MSSTPPDRRTPAPCWRFACLALCLLPAVAVDADRESDLAALRSRLEKLQAELAETRGDRDEARERLRDTERRIGAGLRQLRQTDRRIRRETTHLDTLRRSRRQQQAELETQRNEIGRMIQAHYALGRQDTLKLLLSQEDPALVNRMLTYYRYLADSRAARVDDLQRRLARLDAVEKEIRERQENLTILRTGQQTEQKNLEAARAERRQVLAHLNAEVRNRAKEIARLKRDEARLGQLLRDLHSTLRAEPAPPLTPDLTGKGRWRLPVNGRVMARYGQRRGIGDLRWRGLFIAANEGQPIRAMTGGRVVFADWLRGFGLLVVVDHGKGLMSLYGHNQSLLKNVGDSIEAGETVALSGNTGGPPQPGLYFEVRERGEPRNPLDWCKL